MLYYIDQLYQNSKEGCFYYILYGCVIQKMFEYDVYTDILQ